MTRPGWASVPTIVLDTVGRLGTERAAQARGEHRGNGVEGEIRGRNSGAELELGDRVVGWSACGGDRHEVGGQAEVFEDVCGDVSVGNERDHAQGIAAARALGDGAAMTRSCFEYVLAKHRARDRRVPELGDQDHLAARAQAHVRDDDPPSHTSCPLAQRPRRAPSM